MLILIRRYWLAVILWLIVDTWTHYMMRALGWDKWLYWIVWAVFIVAYWWVIVSVSRRGRREGSSGGKGVSRVYH